MWRLLIFRKKAPAGRSMSGSDRGLSGMLTALLFEYTFAIRLLLKRSNAPVPRFLLRAEPYRKCVHHQSGRRKRFRLRDFCRCQKSCFTDPGHVGCGLCADLNTHDSFNGSSSRSLVTPLLDLSRMKVGQSSAFVDTGLAKNKEQR